MSPGCHFLSSTPITWSYNGKKKLFVIILTASNCSLNNDKYLLKKSSFERVHFILANELHNNFSQKRLSLFIIKKYFDFPYKQQFSQNFGI
jgi:hypothetical protein